MRRNVDIAILALLLAIGLIVVAIIVLLGIVVPQKSSERYVNELQAQSEMIRNVKPVVIGSFAMLPNFNAAGAFEWRREVVPAQLANEPQPVIDATAHDDAVALIDATMTHPNAKRKPGQLMTADECQQYGVLGGDRTRRQGAVDYLCKYFDVQAESGAGPAKNGVYYRSNSGDLSRLMLDMAIKGVPYSAQRPPAAA